MSIRIGIVDDHPMYRDGVVYALATHADIEVLATGETADDAVAIAVQRAPQVVIIDINMPGSGMQAIEEIARRAPDVRILALTVSDDPEQVCLALKLGASGYLLKGSGGTELVQAVRAVVKGQRYVSPDLAGNLFVWSNGRRSEEKCAPLRFSNLTPREQQILSILSEGRSNKEIGNRLDLSEKTVKHHLTNILQKLHVRNRVEAALLASSWRPEHAFAD